jgi:putative NADH-flavin reductase
VKITIFGANGPTGRHLTRQALDEGHDVTAFTRRPESFPEQHEALQVVGGDVYDLPAVEGAVKGRDAVLSTLGVPFTRKPITVYSQGMAHIVSAMEAHGVDRLVCVTSSVLGPHPEPQGGVVYRKVIQPFITGFVGRTLYDDMRRMEELVMASPLDWTIVRPSGLFETPGVTDYRIAEDHILGRFTSRPDLAACVLRQAADTRYLRKVLAVATVSVQPSMVQLVWREGIRKKA